MAHTKDLLISTKLNYHHSVMHLCTLNLSIAGTCLIFFFRQAQARIPHYPVVTIVSVDQHAELTEANLLTHFQLTRDMSMWQRCLLHFRYGVCG